MKELDIKNYNEILRERLITAQHLRHIDKDILENSFSVVYASTNDIFVYNGIGLTNQDKIDLVNALIRAVQKGSNYSREIIAVSNNIYYVY